MSLFDQFFTYYLEARIWIRIRIRVISQDRIRINAMRIHNTVPKYYIRRCWFLFFVAVPYTATPFVNFISVCLSTALLYVYRLSGHSRDSLHLPERWPTPELTKRGAESPHSSRGPDQDHEDQVGWFKKLPCHSVLQCYFEI
jgi:hypothetical protein